VKKLSKKLMICSFSLIMILAQSFFCSVGYADPTTKTGRISGSDRYQTAIAISQNGWQTSAYAVLSRGDDFADASCAGPLAQKYEAPILLTQPAELNRDTLAELKRLGVSHLFIIGGPRAVPQRVEDALKNSGISTIERIYGADRYETSVKIAEKLGSPTQAVLANGSDYPDALAVSVVAAKRGMPILLTAKNSLPAVISHYFKANPITTTYVIGGTDVIGRNPESSVPGSTRLAGDGRYQTNIAILKNFESEFNFENIYVATGGGSRGNEFADALTGAVLAAKTSSPLILTGQTVAAGTADYLKAKLLLATKVTGLGGQGAVPASVLTELLSYKEQIAAAETYDTAGSYGSDTVKTTVKGSVVISAAGVTLKNTVIEGDLLIAQSVGNGNVNLRDVTVKGKTIINGGGPNSVVLYNFNGQTVVVDIPAGGNVRLVAQGTTTIAKVAMESNGTLEESGLSGNGFVNVEIPVGAEVTLAGTFEQVSVEAGGANVNVTSGTIATMTIADTAVGAAVNLAGGATVSTLNANAASNVTGTGSIRNANINVSNVSLQQTPAAYTVANGASVTVNGTQQNGTGATTTTSSGGDSGGSSGGGGGDTTAPSFAATYPKAGAAQAAGSKQVEVLVQVNENGTAYYVVVADNAAAPSAAQVIAGQDSTDAAAFASASALVTANTEKSFLTAALPAAATAYDVYVVVKDDSNNATPATKVDVTTPSAAADTTILSFAATYPKAGAAQAAGSKQVEVLVQVNENGTAYYVVVPDNAAAPSAAQVIAGQDSTDAAAFASASAAVTADTEKSLLTAALPAAATAYDVYVVVKDDSNNATAASKVDVTTPAAADTTAPTFTATYPKAGAAQAVGSKQVEVLVQVNENGTAYYVVVADNAAAPSAAQVIAGHDSAAAAAFASASALVTANTEKSFLTAALPADATAYDVYVVVKDDSNNATPATKVDVTTPAEDLGPQFVNDSFNIFEDGDDIGNAIKVEFLTNQPITSLAPADFRIGTTSEIAGYDTFDAAVAVTNGYTQNKRVTLIISGGNADIVRGFGPRAKLLINPANNGNDIASTNANGKRVRATGLLPESSGNQVYDDQVMPRVLNNLSASSVYVSNIPDASGNGYSWVDIQFTETLDMSNQLFYMDDFIFSSGEGAEVPLTVRSIGNGKTGPAHDGTDDPTRIRYYFNNGSIVGSLKVRADNTKINIRDLKDRGPGNYNVYVPSQTDIDGFTLNI